MYGQALLGVGTIVLLLVLLVYGGIPLIVRQSVKQPAVPQLIPFPLDHPDLPAEVGQEFQSVIDQLRPAGFEPITGFAMPNATSNVKSIVLFLVNRQAKDIATATVTHAPPLLSFYVEFFSHFRYGTRQNTNNSRTDLEIFAPWPLRKTYQFPQVRDAGQLYRLHQALIARSGMRDKVFRLDEEFHGDAAAALATWGTEVLVGHAVGPGYMYLSPSENVYRLTWKGTFLVTWKLLWPRTAIRRAARYRKARRLLAELEA
jgi:hypothetical protein